MWRWVFSLLLWLLAGTVLSAQYGITEAFQTLGERMKETLQQTSVILGPLMTLFGGGRVAVKFSQGEPAIVPLAMVIVGVALFAGAGSASFDARMVNVTGGISTITSRASLVLGGAVALIGGGITAAKFIRGDESAIKSLVLAIVASAIAVVTVRAVGGR